MALNLNDFMAEVRGLGIQRANRFRVEINPPSSLQVGGTGLLGALGDLGELTRSRQLSLRCTHASFPGVQLMTKDDVFRYGVGPVDKTVHHALFSDISCAFVLDGKGLIEDFFYRWQKSTVNFDSSDSMDTATNGALPYEVAYKDDYITTMEITQLNELNQKVVKCTAQKVFPVNVGDIQLGWDMNDAVAILPVTFSYRDHKLKTF